MPIPGTAQTNRHRLRWWTELPLVVVVYAAYSAGRLLARGNEADAVGHGLGILRLEEGFRIDFERPLNRLFSGTPAIGVPADFIYASLHYLVTPAILVWLFRRRPAGYRAARTWLMVSTLLGLIGFTLLPTCPPRLLSAGHGFTDTMAQFSSYGWWGGEASAPRGLGGMTNQFAAMPSLHVGWALWCGVMLWLHARGPLARTTAVAYPVVITLVVMGTANHYFLDAAAGVAVMGAGLLLTRPVTRLTDRVRAGLGRGSAGAVTGTRAPIVGGGCETSAGEHIPGQRTSSAGAGDSTPAATR
ncbi:phosphatase PAP2 family protein [Streptomyces sp. NPDC057445]|uniref:phosphatase PAP2 family protein n=1 Tax=Streptomyces sp. NPDC057445 TaxID=3346136 RepID=UPI0036C0E827